MVGSMDRRKVSLALSLVPGYILIRQVKEKTSRINSSQVLVPMKHRDNIFLSEEICSSPSLRLEKN
jgi:hypothetical protein